MSVTELHRVPEGRRPAADPHEVSPRHTPSIAVLILDHAPDPAEVAKLYDDFEVVLIAHDATTAVALLQGMASAPPAFAPPPVPVTPLFEEQPFRREALGLTLDATHHRATWRGRVLPLTSRERAILACLLAEPGRVWSYRELYEQVWDGCYLGDPSLVHSALKRVRRKIREAGVSLTIDAVRGVGFRAEPTD